MRSLHPAAVSSPLGSSSSRVWTTLDLFDRPLGSRCDIQLKEPGRVAKKKKKKKKSGQEGGPNKGCSTGRRQQGATNTHTHTLGTAINGLQPCSVRIRTRICFIVQVRLHKQGIYLQLGLLSMYREQFFLT